MFEHAALANKDCVLYLKCQPFSSCMAAVSVEQCAAGEKRLVANRKLEVGEAGTDEKGRL